MPTPIDSTIYLRVPILMMGLAHAALLTATAAAREPSTNESWLIPHLREPPRRFELPERGRPRGQSGRDPLCASEELLQESLKPLYRISLDIQPKDQDLPPDCYRDSTWVGREQAAPTVSARHCANYHFHWLASGLTHQPLYFEDVALERYGQGYSPVVQPFVSVGWFYGSVISLPYRIGLEPPHIHIYTLGQERPGSHAPSVREHLPWSWRAAFLQAGVAVGGGALLP